MITDAPLYVEWDDDLRSAFERAAVQIGALRLARELEVGPSRALQFRRGIAGEGRPRRYIALRHVEVVARILEEPMIEARQAFTHSEIARRGYLRRRNGE